MNIHSDILVESGSDKEYVTFKICTHQNSLCNITAEHPIDIVKGRNAYENSLTLYKDNIVIRFYGPSVFIYRSIYIKITPI